MKRIFAKLVGFQNGWGINILSFDTETKQVEQILSNGKNQSGMFTDMRYVESQHRLTFVVGGHLEEFPIYEISEETLVTMTRPDNWTRLVTGLTLKSDKTRVWCNNRGIYG